MSGRQCFNRFYMQQFIKQRWLVDQRMVSKNNRELIILDIGIAYLEY